MNRYVLLMAALVASTPQAGVAASPRFSAAGPIAFHCTVSGVKNLQQGVTPPQVCSLFQRRIDRAIARQTRASAAWPGTGNAISVTIRATSPREISAAAIVRVNRQIRHVPEITLDVMDKSPGLRDLELLADQLARAIVH